MRRIVFWVTIFMVFFAVTPAVSAFSEDVCIVVEEKECVFDPPPFIREGTTMVPMRNFFELMGAEVEWCNDERAAFGFWDEREVKIPNGATEPKVDGEKVSMGNPAEINDGSLYVPLRLIATAFDFEIDWDAKQRAVIIEQGNDETDELVGLMEQTASAAKGITLTATTGEEIEETKEAEATEEESSEGNSGFIWPVEGGQVVSEYGMRWGRMHYGLDIGAAEGTPILAVDSGEVVISEWESSGYGYSVVIKHGEDFYTRYAHNSTNLVNVGEQVKQGDIIAEIGATGNATTPHVHFEVRVGGTGNGNDSTHRNPKDYLDMK